MVSLYFGNGIKYKNASSFIYYCPMNPFLNPITGIPFIKNFIFAPGRLQRLTPKQMSKYRDKAFRKIVKYAYTAPLYHKKYKEAGIYPDDIKGINDITKLPFITKMDLVKNFPDGINPIGYNKNKAAVACTSGSSGNPVSIFIDFPTMSQGIVVYLRELKLLNLHWKKTKIVHIGNLRSIHPDVAFEKMFLSKAKSLTSLKNVMNMNASDPIKDIIKKLDGFKPDIIMTYPTTLQHIAYFKKNGYGGNITPKILMVGGAVTDEYTKKYVEDAFGCPLLNIYGSTESGANIAFECMEGTWHINYDFFHVESVDEDMELVDPGKRGQIILTNLFGNGTPIIRYTGMNDWVRLRPRCECDCGLNTPIIMGGVEGRVSASIVLPDGRLMPSAQSIMSIFLSNMNSLKVKQYQIVQRKIDEIDLLFVIDDDLRKKGPSVDFIFEKAKEIYQKKLGPDVRINVKEVKEIKSPPEKPAQLVISHVKLNEIKKILEPIE